MEKFLSKSLLNKKNVDSTEKMIINLNRIVKDFSLNFDKQKFDIFLSHKHSDKELVYKFIKFLESLNLKIYIDWLDDEMPLITDHVTALKLKDKIKNSKKFVLLATDEAINSKWCNWELGFGDAHKYFESIAILPVTDSDDGKWTGNEYLKIYPAITISERSNEQSELFVEFMGKKVKFTDWLKN
ncbi:toll/interleukin-1 receptor domain-containing protein [Flavobacterium sp.]|jgi:hypothetical protein|uniref:toll/interleukin-1 receptor domain-containing protein n=1 Tax=Flavobacterium sp. TaxID=239 RepID=UPI0022CA88B9|nr:toll/interleukin-1 receptor domain-containing protein [Flavobacterium sp.]MCZ8145309.1 toll/interleukin-1 receptor domain-containing protein [Flavobacterium sp.]MCZ8368159.1 toll/interleukin-1 receptor domain-containing protein [Flavobacterium sp.]